MRNLEKLENDCPGKGERSCIDTSNKLDVVVVKPKHKKKRKHECSETSTGREDFDTNKETADIERKRNSKRRKHKNDRESFARNSNEDSGVSQRLLVLGEGNGKRENGVKKRKAKGEKGQWKSSKSTEKLEYPKEKAMTNNDSTEYVGNKINSTVIYDESGQKFKVFENGEKKKWYDIWYREDSIMTLYGKKWVKREAVPHLEKLKKEIENEYDEVTKQKLERKYRNFRQKAGKELKAYIIKCHKNPQNTGREEKTAVPINFEENEVMTRFQGVWVKRSAMTWLDASIKKMYVSRNGVNESEQLVEPEVQKKIKKLLRFAHRQLRMEVIKKLKGHGGEYIKYDENYGENKSKTCSPDELETKVLSAFEHKPTEHSIYNSYKEKGKKHTFDNDWKAKNAFERLDEDVHKGGVTGRKFIFDEYGDIIENAHTRKKEDINKGKIDGGKVIFDEPNMKDTKKGKGNDFLCGKIGNGKKIIFDDDGVAVEDIHKERIHKNFTEENDTSCLEKAHIASQCQGPNMNSSVNLKPLKTKKPSKFLNIKYDDNPDIVKSDGFYVSRKGLKRLNKLKGELSAKGMPDEKLCKILRKERQKEERLVKRKHKLRTEEKEETDKLE